MDEIDPLLYAIFQRCCLDVAPDTATEGKLAMMRTCEKCNKLYDDAECSTLCPHRLIMPREDLDRKIEALKLSGKWVRFNHQTDKERHRVIAITGVGMILLDGIPGEFAPHLFVEVKP